MNDIVFNGYRLDVRSGLGFAAQTTGMGRGAWLADGDYAVTDSGDFNPSFFPHEPSCEGLNQTLDETHVLELAPRVPLFSPMPLYLYDFGVDQRLGIKTEQAFFRCLASLSPFTPSDGYSLRIRHAAPWMQTAEGELGQSEVPGSRANPRILEYFGSSNFWGTDDSGGENAWCASFIAWVMEQHGYTPPSAAFRAKSWKNFGQTISQPVYGAIGVKSRTGGGHVAFVAGQSSDGSKLYMLGGNQSDEVNISEYPRSVWETFVVPTHYDASTDSLPVYSGLSVAAGSEG